MSAKEREVCISCGQEYDMLPNMATCPDCGWFICPICSACLCTLTPSAKVAAIAMWLSEMGSQIPEDVRQGWLKFLRIMTGSRSWQLDE